MSENHNELPERLNPAGMARMLKMSRARLYQLMNTGTFPQPNRDDPTHPYFTREQQAQILQIYKTNVGLDGKSIFFRPKETRTPPPSRMKRPTSALTQDSQEFLSAIRGLGLTQVKRGDLQEAIAAVFPGGTVPEDKSLAVKQLFLHLRQKYSSDKAQ